VSGWADHLVIAPILLPLLAGVLMLLFDARSRNVKAAINVWAALSSVALAAALLRQAGSGGGPDVYLLGNWPAPFGIVLVLDRLSALMLLLTSVLSVASLLFSLATWHRAGVHFHPLFQFLLMGLNGAFLTGDLFNLFVFFEVTLAASYGLVLHGSGIARIRAGLHYVAVNLANSSLFLIGAGLIYGAAGTLNMADLAASVAQVAPEDRMLLEAGGALLGVAFLVKAGMWPLGFWLPTAYTAASPPAAAIFAIMTKLGAYVLLRLWLLWFGDGAGGSTGFGGAWLLYGGLMTITFGMIGVLAAQEMARIAAYSVLVSSGTVLAAIGTGQVTVTAGALYYLVSSTLALSALFLLIELVERGREFGADMLAVTSEAFGEPEESEPDDEEVGLPLPVTMGLLGICFLACAALLAGLPPLSGFVGKFSLLAGLVPLAGPGGAPRGSGVDGASWAFVALLMLSGLAVLIAMTRAGVHAFWSPIEREEVPKVRVVEMAPIAGLLLLCVILTVQAGPVMEYMATTARTLHDPVRYVDGVLAAPRAQPDAEDGR
jgi:multicomponent K+:H+ antiporter subunit D